MPYEQRLKIVQIEWAIYKLLSGLSHELWLLDHVSGAVKIVQRKEQLLTPRLSAGTLQLMSPTTFWTGSLVLGGLFIYDIVMVFYTYVIATFPISLLYSRRSSARRCHINWNIRYHRSAPLSNQKPAHQRPENFFWYPWDQLLNQNERLGIHVGQAWFSEGIIRWKKGDDWYLVF